MGKPTYYQQKYLVEKATKQEQIDLLFDLVNSFRSMKDPYEVSLLMQDMFTKSEILQFAKRLRIAKLILRNDLTHREISKEVKCSVATVTKVNEWLKLGGEGFKTAILRLPRRYKYPKKLPRKPLEFQLPRLLLTIAQYSIAHSQQKKITKTTRMLSHSDDKKLLDKQLKQIFKDQYSK